MPTKTEAKILEGLEPLCVPTAWLDMLPGNPRRGDIKAVAESLSKLGCHRPVVAWRQGERGGNPYGLVLAGNHQLAAFRMLGWDRIPVVWTTDDEKVARARTLADNRTHDIGDYDDDLLAEMLSYVADDPDLLAATAYTEADIAKLIEGGTPAGDGDEAKDPATLFGVIVECDSEEEQDTVLQEQIDAGRRARALL